MGVVGVRVTFYDVQTNRTYTTNTTASVWVTYNTTGLSSNLPSFDSNSSTVICLYRHHDDVLFRMVKSRAP